MAATSILTAQDCIDYAVSYEESHSISADREKLAWVIHNAYQELAQVFDWSFLYRQDRILLAASQSTGTAAFDFTGGACERMLTLTGATWPDWAGDGSVRIDGVPCRVESVVSDTIATLDATMNPGRDVAAGASYRLYHGYYRLPNDFKRLVTPRAEVVGWEMHERSYNDLMALERDYDESGTPIYYCIRGIEDLYGAMGMFVYPDSNENKTLDFVYERYAREVLHTGHASADAVGSIATTLSSTAVVGTGTAFDETMVGSMIRIGRTASKPTGLRGFNPYRQQQVVAAVADATHLTLDSAASAAASAVGYVVTDPIDIDVSMHLAMLSCIVKNLAYMQEWKDVKLHDARYQEALSNARAANSRSSERRYAGAGAITVRRLAKISAYTGDL